MLISPGLSPPQNGPHALVCVLQLLPAGLFRPKERIVGDGGDLEGRWGVGHCDSSPYNIKILVAKQYGLPLGRRSLWESLPGDLNSMVAPISRSCGDGKDRAVLQDEKNIF